MHPGASFIPRQAALEILRDDLETAKSLVLARLINVNIIIIAASGIAAYILAGKTLKPLEETLEEQKRFTADASHELKTPLTALRTEIEVALRDRKLNLKKAKSLLRSNLEEVIGLQNLSENLVRLTRYSQDTSVVNFEKVNIAEVIDEAIKKISPMAKQKAIRLVREVKETSLKADKQSLIELLVILLDNAIKYSPEKSAVTVSAHCARHRLEIKIHDQGIGIAKKDIPHLFDRFYRADASRNKNKIDGTGLGLAIAKEIVEKHRGKISVRGSLGKGSTFTVSLPT
jgi:signal transduction histidine kinase